MNLKKGVLWLALLGAMGAALTFPGSSEAIPGDSVDTAAVWLKQQKLFTLHPVEPVDWELLLFRPLSPGKELVYTLVPDESNVIWEEIKVVAVQAEDNNACRYFFAKDYLSTNDTACYQGLGVSFFGRSPQLFEMLELVYGDRASIVAEDLKQAELLKQGQWHYNIDTESQSLHRLRNGPVDVSLYQGKRFVYFLTPFSLYLTLNSQPDVLRSAQDRWAEDEQRELERNRLLEKLWFPPSP